MSEAQAPFVMVSSAAIDDKELTKTDCMVYAALCRHADIKTGKCSPAIDKICEVGRCSRAIVFDSLKKLAHKGYIAGASRLTEDGRRTSHIYTVKYLKERPTRVQSGTGTVQSGTGGRVQSGTTNYINTLNKTSNTLSAQPTASLTTAVTFQTAQKKGPGLPAAKEFSAAFESFWQLYPRKKEKIAAFRAWNKTLKLGADEAQLIKAGGSYAAEIRRLGTEERYIKLPATFLGPSEPWRDYLVQKPAKTLSEIACERFGR